jgi:hypothetical protein
MNTLPSSPAGLVGPVALPVVGDAGDVGDDVAAELAYRLEQLGLGVAGPVDVEVDRQVIDDPSTGQRTMCATRRPVSTAYV